MADAVPVTRGDQLIPTFAVSRDGRWLVYDSHLAGNRDIYRVHLSGGEPDRLTDDLEEDLMPSWSPDGAEIAFQSRRHGTHDVFVVNGDGTNLRRVTSAPGDERTPAWSPDGTSLAYAGEDGLYVVERASRSGVFGPPRRIMVGRATSARWSPDGRYIAFVAPDGSPRIVPADGGEAQTLWSATAANRYARPEEFRGVWLDWSVDGSVLYYRVPRGTAGWRIWAIRLSRSAPQLLFDESDPSHFYGPAMAADSHRLYFGAGWNESDIWLVTLRPR
jgi:Tol biopolymer transport system component